MIGLDTNVLVRLIVGDDPAQTKRAKAFVETRCTPESPAFINALVLVELAWVLASVYGYRRSEIATAFDALLSGEDRVIEHHDEVRASVAEYRAGRGDLVDVLIAAINRSRGCDATATFDRKAGRVEGFTLIS